MPNFYYLTYEFESLEKLIFLKSIYALLKAPHLSPNHSTKKIYRFSTLRDENLNCGDRSFLLSTPSSNLLLSTPSAPLLSSFSSHPAIIDTHLNRHCLVFLSLSLPTLYATHLPRHRFSCCSCHS